MSPLWFWDGPQDWLPCNVTAPAYAPPMGTFPVDPADVPPEAVSVMKHTLLRHADAIAADPLDEETARTITWVLMNWLARDNHKTPGGRDDTRSRA